MFRKEGFRLLKARWQVPSCPFHPLGCLSMQKAIQQTERGLCCWQSSQSAGLLECLATEGGCFLVSAADFPWTVLGFPRSRGPSGHSVA